MAFSPEMGIENVNSSPILHVVLNINPLPTSLPWTSSSTLKRSLSKVNTHLKFPNSSFEILNWHNVLASKSNKSYGVIPEWNVILFSVPIKKIPWKYDTQQFYTFIAFKGLTLLTWKSSLSKGSHITIFNQSVRSTKFCHATWRLKAVKWLKRLPSSRLSKRSQRNLRKYRVVKFRFFFSTDENTSVIFVSTVLLLIHIICTLSPLHT